MKGYFINISHLLLEPKKTLQCIRYGCCHFGLNLSKYISMCAMMWNLK